MDDYVNVNKASWNARLESHLASEFYDVPSFLQGRSSLNCIELEMLGNVEGKSILHLQCHFGQDTISLSRLGADVVGVDLSDKAVEKAKELNEQSGAQAEFICSDVYELPKVLEKRFDIVYTSYGTISWLPDLTKWAQVIDHFLKPGGKFVFVEFHPLIWMFDDDMQKIVHHYNNVLPLVEEEQGTYADPDADIEQACVCWNHGIGEVASALITQGMRIDRLEEHDHAPYPFVRNMEEYEPGKFRIKQFANMVPLVYSTSATKAS